ncbi:DUF2953 domain-containing protein [Brevibacillus panacihumi]|uniref:DUF2953 domain-containing protein n=1 Tax=Brevibacillus panacihumi TaxID=497735 RepID=A0A3M8CQ00_9BACL|nr:DUF2953 domain-containing protein [Brevibacillus panacihumi]RNB77748.1 DUF2953 domain-containing protein [Brevibacillus panacihumi]
MSLFVLFLVIVFTPVHIHVYYGRVDANDHLVLELSAWFRLIRRKYEIPKLAIKPTEKGPEMVYKMETLQQEKKKKEKVDDVTHRQVQTWYRRYQDFLRRFRDVQPVFKHFFKRIRCTKLEWHTAMGTGQADETGALTGMVWSIKSVIVGVASHTLSFRTMPRISVQPVWNQSLLQTQIQCNLRLYVGDALLAGIKILLRTQLNRRRKWQTAAGKA